MKVCHRCGHQGEADWVAVEVREHGSDFGAITFRQPFLLCAICVQQLFDVLSQFVTTSEEWEPPSEEQDDG